MLFGYFKNNFLTTGNQNKHPTDRLQNVQLHLNCVSTLPCDFILKSRHRNSNFTHVLVIMLLLTKRTN